MAIFIKCLRGDFFGSGYFLVNVIPAQACLRRVNWRESIQKYPFSMVFESILFIGFLLSQE
jgi:hypothetical protein